MKKQHLTTAMFSLIFLAFSLLIVHSNMSASSTSTVTDKEWQMLTDNATKIENEILKTLPISVSHKLDPFVQISEMELVKVAYPDIYGGYVIEDGKLIIKLTNSSKKLDNKDQLMAVRKIARKYGASKIRYVRYSLNELNALYAKAGYYASNTNEANITMAALDDGIVLVGFAELNKENVDKAKKLLGNSDLLEFVEFSFKDD